MDWSWSILIPETMLTVGGWAFILAFVVQIVTPENSKAALWLALIGGFGVAGGVGGWFGEMLTGTTTAAVDLTSSITTQAVGTSFPFLLFAILALVFWRKAGTKGQGLQSKGGKKKDKVKQVAALLAFSVLGAALSAFPWLYSGADTAVAAAAGFVIDVLPS